jgi:heme/copper-type cytochrome/quinol oxidase subunit 2
MPAIVGSAPVLTILLAGCAAPLSTLDPAGPHAGGVARLWWIMLAGCTTAFAVMAVLLTLAFVRRGKARAGLWLGFLGTALPVLLLTSLTGYAFAIGRAGLPLPAANVVAVEATGHRFYWTFRQPGPGRAIATRDTLHIPAGQPIDVHIRSADVIHSFWVPRLAGKMDAIPGHTHVLRIEAARPGTYAGRCAEFCGLGHAVNRFTVVAHDAAGWAAFQANGA